MYAAVSDAMSGVLMEYVEGGSLFQLLHVSRAVMSGVQRLKVTRGIAHALAYLHEQKIVHYDVKVTCHPELKCLASS